jgi:hypothetical protein
MGWNTHKVAPASVARLDPAAELVRRRAVSAYRPRTCDGARSRRGAAGGARRPRRRRQDVAAAGGARSAANRRRPGARLGRSLTARHRDGEALEVFSVPWARSSCLADNSFRRHGFLINRYGFVPRSRPDRLSVRPCDYLYGSGHGFPNRVPVELGTQIVGLRFHVGCDLVGDGAILRYSQLG